MKQIVITLILYRFNEKNHHFLRVVLVQVNKLILAVDMALKSYTTVAKRLKLELENFWWEGLSRGFLLLSLLLLLLLLLF